MENINSAVADKVHPHRALSVDLNSYFVEIQVDSFFNAQTRKHTSNMTLFCLLFCFSDVKTFHNVVHSGHQKEIKPSQVALVTLQLNT